MGTVLNYSPSNSQELADAERALREHRASWAYAYANAGGCHGGTGHPAHRAVHDRTSLLVERLAAARQAATLKSLRQPLERGSHENGSRLQ